MIIYTYKNLSDAFHAIHEISSSREAKISFFSGEYAIPKDLDSLDVESLPAEVKRTDVLSLSGEELMLQYKDSDARGMFLSFPLTEGIVFRLIFFEAGILAISVLSKTRISVGIPEDVEETLEKYGIRQSAG